MILGKHLLSYRSKSADLWPVRKITAYWAKLTMERTSSGSHVTNLGRYIGMSTCSEKSTEAAESELRRLCASWPCDLEALWKSASFICKRKQKKNFYLMRFLRNWEEIIDMISFWEWYLPSCYITKHHGRMGTGPWSRPKTIASQLPEDSLDLCRHTVNMCWIYQCNQIHSLWLVEP